MGAQKHEGAPGRQSEVTLPGVQPLPSGWEEVIDEQGRSFFLDHNTRSSTWTDPRSTPANSAECRSDRRADAESRGPVAQLTMAPALLTQPGLNSGQTAATSPPIAAAASSAESSEAMLDAMLQAQLEQVFD
jgi:hypothetical protein